MRYAKLYPAALCFCAFLAAVGLILGDPANYLKYYIGYVEFLELKKEAIHRWGDDFSQEKFHKAVLEVGPAPFDLLREYVVES